MRAYRTRVWLDVDAPDLRVEVESLERTFLAESLENIDVLVSSVITSARKTLRVLVSEDRTVGFHSCPAGQVLHSSRDVLSSMLDGGSVATMKVDT